MQIAFNIGDQPALFNRNWFTGQAALTVGGRRNQLQGFWKSLFTIDFEVTRYWQFDVSGHSIVIQKTRPLLFAGFRPQSYCVLVDGAVVAEAHGY